MGIVCFCAVYGTSGLSYRLAFYRPDEFVLLLGNMKQPYMLLAGVIGAFITVTVVKSMADLGPARAAMLIVISQLAVAYVIELFGMFGVEKQPFEWRKLIGLLVSVTGIIVFKW